MLREWYQALAMAGLDVRKVLMSIRGVPAFVMDFRSYYRASSGGGLPIRLSHMLPVLSDRYEHAGVAIGHYFFQDLWAARKIYTRQPSRHVDIGSSIGGFVSQILVFTDQVEVVDIRPLHSKVPGLVFVQDDATLLSDFGDDSVDSLSSLHAAEHFGLGRYGDPVDPEAHLKFLRALVRVLKPGGRLYFSGPTGVERLAFNAHRILSPATILRACAGLTLVSFALVKDDGYLYEDASLDEAGRQVYGCGLYEFTKTAGLAG
jgi:SAM-dependent methyltransferase